MGNINDLKNTFDILQNAAEDIREAIKNGTGSHTTTEYTTSEDGNTKSYTRTTTTTNFSTDNYKVNDDNYVTYEEKIKQHETRKKRKAAAPKVIKFILTIWVLSMVLPIVIPVVFSSIGFILDAYKAAYDSSMKDKYAIEDTFDHAVEEAYPEYAEDILDEKPDTENVSGDKTDKKLDFKFKLPKLPESDTNWPLLIIGAVGTGIVLLLILRKVTTKKEKPHEQISSVANVHNTTVCSDATDKFVSDNFNDNITDTEDSE